MVTTTTKLASGRTKSGAGGDGAGRRNVAAPTMIAGGTTRATNGSDTPADRARHLLSGMTTVSAASAANCPRYTEVHGPAFGTPIPLAAKARPYVPSTSSAKARLAP